MKQNVGSVDRIVRLVLAVFLAYLYFGNVVTGTLGIVLLVMAVVFTATAALGYCPIWQALNFSTKK